MVSRAPEPTESNPPEPAPAASRPVAPRWALRDWLAATALFAATAAVVLWQNAHVAVLFDLSYILNTAERIALGQVPYRDFPLAHAPLTFLIQAAIIRLTGRVFFHHVLYAAITGGLGTVLAWRIALTSLRGRVTAAWTLALALAAPLIFLGVYSIVPTPEYDCDCGFWLLVAIWAFTQLDRRKSALFAFAAGASACIPMFFKQNMGLPLFLIAVGAVLVVLVLAQFSKHQHSSNVGAPGASHLGTGDSTSFRTSLVAFLAGACAALLAALLALHSTAGLGNYLHWTIQYAGQRRLPGLSPMLGVYRDPTLAWTLPCMLAALLLLRLPHPLRSFIARRVGFKSRWPQIAAFALLAAPFLFTLASLLLYDDPDERGDALLALWPLVLVLAAALALANLFALRRQPSLRSFLPLLLLAAIHGTFMSQQLWGSTYGIWPLLILLLAELLASLAAFTARANANRWFTPALAAIISITLLVCGGFYTASEERLNYANLPDSPPAHSAFPGLAGLATPGPYIPEIDELLRYAQVNIPFDDGIVLIPGEEPFYFATGRNPHFPVPFFDPTIDPYSPPEIAALVRTHNIRWLIVKNDVQTKEDPTPDRAELMQLLTEEFRLVTHLRGYDVYRR
ncbi:MAG: hypothetical protein P4K93_13325 [Terracidiphilus sp.]|nr:hypothetical protein [Terracidiphilus sp.]MDR3799132.1 hypothetical protein [Terracidiphilus sp.]